MRRGGAGQVSAYEIWSAVTRAALCAGRGTALARHPAPVLLLKKRRHAEYRLPPHSKSFRLTCEYRNGHKTRARLACPLSLTDYDGLRFSHPRDCRKPRSTRQSRFCMIWRLLGFH